jgi:hypothetical protein
LSLKGVKIDLFPGHLPSQGPKFSKENLHFFESCFPAVYDKALLEAQIEDELINPVMLPQDAQIFIELYAKCTKKEIVKFEDAYREARRFFNVNRQYFYANDWMAMVNGKRTNLAKMTKPKGEVPEYLGFWDKPR